MRKCVFCVQWVWDSSLKKIMGLNFKLWVRHPNQTQFVNKRSNRFPRSGYVDICFPGFVFTLMDMVIFLLFGILCSSNAWSIWKCSRPGLRVVWATWSCGQCPYPWQEGWNQVIFQACLNPNNFATPWLAFWRIVSFLQLNWDIWVSVMSLINFPEFFCACYRYVSTDFFFFFWKYLIV